MESEGMNIKLIILLAFLLSTGVLLNILACVIYGQWLAFLTVIAYFFAPLPNLFFQRCGSDPLDVSGRNFKDLGYFLTGIFVVSGFALPAVLAHVEVIRWEAMALALAGGIIVYATILGYLHKFYIKDDAF